MKKIKIKTIEMVGSFFDQAGLNKVLLPLLPQLPKRLNKLTLKTVG